VALPWSFNAFMALCLVVHLCFSEPLFYLSRHDIDAVACVLLALGIEVYCIYPIYRVVTFMSFFLLLNVPSLLRGRRSS